MVIENTNNIKPTGNLVLIVYGKGGVGKTTFAASSPNCLILDFENGTKYLGERGFNVNVIRLSEWLSTADKNELAGLIRNYDTVVVDPLGEAMEKLINGNTISGSKFRQGDGSLSIAGWGEAKKQMRSFIKWLRDTGKNIIFVAHDAEEKDGDSIVHRIQIATKLREEIPNIVDVISYLGVKMVEENPVRVLFTPRQGDQFDSKDRTGRVPMTVEVSERNGFQDFLNSMGPVQNEIIEPDNTKSKNNNSNQTNGNNQQNSNTPNNTETENNNSSITDILSDIAVLINHNKELFASYELVEYRRKYEEVKEKNDAIALHEEVLNHIRKKNPTFNDENVPFEETIQERLFEEDPIPLY